MIEPDPGAAGQPEGIHAAVLDFMHAPLRALLQLEAQCWESLDHDPQFLLTLPVAQAAGLYRITARLHGAPVRSPCLYVDTGAGWGEHSRIDLEETPGGGLWSALVELGPFSASVRFDPADLPGSFNFEGVTLQRVPANETLLQLLDEAAMRDPSRAAAWLHDARLVLDGAGAIAAIRALRGDGQVVHAGSRAETYRQWVARFDSLAPAQQAALAVAVEAMPQRPLLSLVLPVADGHESMLDGLVGSLHAQLYPDWELCIVHAAGIAPDAEALLAAQAARSSRVRMLPAPSEPSHDAMAVAGIAAATGAFTAVIGHELRLAPHALLAMVDAIRWQPGAQVLYADHDHLDAGGRRLQPDFKPDWDPDLFLTCDYLGPLVLHVAGAERADDGNNADRSMRERALDIGARVSRGQVVHVPHVLCHLANVPASASTDAAVPAGALHAHLSRCQPEAGVIRSGDALRVLRLLPADAPKVSIVIPTRDGLDLLERCVASILSLTTYGRYEIVVVDNQSADPATLAYFESVQGDPRVRVLAYDSAFNYSALNNFAVAQVDGDVVALLNNDIEVISPGWLEEMLQYAMRPDVGAVGAMLYYPDDTVQHAGVIVGLGGVAGHAHAHQPRGLAGRARHVRSVSAVTAACLLVRRDSYLQVGGLDESLAIAFNDIDFCLRLGALGLRTLWTPFAELYHHESASRGSEDTTDKQARFEREVQLMLTRWDGQLNADPYYNPNLSLVVGHEYALADPPRALLSDWAAAVAGTASALDGAARRARPTGRTQGQLHA